MQASVVAVSKNGRHALGKANAFSIRLVAGFGVEGDVHAGETVKHRSLAVVTPTAPNLRQVHLIHAELLDELATKGFAVAPGQIGENITTKGIDLLGLPKGTRLHVGGTAIVEVTGLRNPCTQLNGLYPGLMAALIVKENGEILRKSGVMGVVIAGGDVNPGDAVSITMPETPFKKLIPV